MGSNSMRFKKQPECRGARTGLWLSQCFLKICALRCRFENKAASGYEVFFSENLCSEAEFFVQKIDSGCDVFFLEI